MYNNVCIPVEKTPMDRTYLDTSSPLIISLIKSERPVVREYMSNFIIKDVVVVRDFGEDRYIMADQYSTL